MKHIRLFDSVEEYLEVKDSLEYPNAGLVMETGTDGTKRGRPVFVPNPEIDIPEVTTTTTTTKAPDTTTDLSLFDIYGGSISRTTANCYVIKSTGDYKFPLVYGNALKNGATNSAAYTKVAGDYSMDFVNHADTVITDPWIKNNGCTPQSAIISMSDTDGAISDLEIENDYCYFTVNSVPDVGGNVVISVTDSANTILWNWHIWLWKDSLEVATITNSSGNEYNILPVNLASKWDTGKSTIKNWFYQWGRSVPMLCPSAYNSTTDHTNYGTKTFTKITKATTYGEGIKNPQNFYYNSRSPYNWFGSSSYYNLWDADCTSTGNSDDSIIKTIYDPSPIGFTIPNGNTFTGFSTSNVVGSFNSGYYFKKYSEDTTGLFFPASGCRSSSSGSLGIVGSRGYVWLSSASSQDDASGLYFSGGRVYPQDNWDRAYGLSVRPVQEG